MLHFYYSLPEFTGDVVALFILGMMYPAISKHTMSIFSEW